MKTVAFYQPFMNERGTCVAMYNYAYYNEKLLGNKSFFIYDSLDVRNETYGLNLIKDSFDTYDIRCSNYPEHNQTVNERNNKLDEVLEKNNADYIYICKSGHNDGVIPTKAKVLVQAVGMVDPKEAHGDVWAYVSYFVNNTCANGQMPVVPYMVSLPDEDDDLRYSLGIKDEYTVIGRYGGIDTFDIPWVKDVIAKVLNDREDIFFLFLNTPVFIQHERVLFLDKIVDLKQKVRYINTCDALLHARWVGESFGMACAEFSYKNKPVMTLFNCPERNHIDILGDKGLYYTSPDTLYNLLLNFTLDKSVDWNCYGDYSPEKIMEIFEKVYLNGSYLSK